ncbi:MAG: RimK family alpha-L-glutamate ligase [Candidatus Gracilibacteria bacterium]|jgi:ribosomal protein S6--L-glutamate ligase
MKIAILCFRSIEEKFSYEENRLKNAAILLGHTARLYRVLECELVFDEDGPSVHYRGKPFPKVDVVIPRVALLNNVSLYASIVKQFQLMGVRVVNRYESITMAKNKLKTLQILSYHGVNVPKTCVISTRESLKGAVKKMGGFPVILKSPFGSWGAGVMIAESYRSALSFIDSLWAGESSNKNKQNMILVQEYVKESRGRDTRIFIVGGKVVASMERFARKGEFRSNAALGGAGKKVSASKEYQNLALKATRLLGLQVSGVDIITTRNGPAVLELNANPGFKELESSTGVDVAKAIIKEAVR